MDYLAVAIPAPLTQAPSRPSSPSQRHVVVDMTPLGPNGENGGAGLVATSLVRHVGALAPELRITLLTARANHTELAWLDAPNIRRECVVASPPSPGLARRLANRWVPAPARVRLARAHWSLATSAKYAHITDRLRPDLLLCPFTVPSFWRPGVPCVSIVYDLQHEAYPQFFTLEQRLNRRRHLEDACARTDRIVCISNYVRGTLLASVDVRPDRVVTIPLGVLQDLQTSESRVVERLSLTPGEFLLYPANFWPHKNHRTLFSAVRIYRQNHPESRLKVVCTGAPNAYLRSLQVEARAPGAVVFAGYVDPADLHALFEACRAVIVPSLYEGFGMPVLEAMAHAKPVLCSNVTSLPEVAGDAAIYFDPTDARAIASAIEALGDDARIAVLVRRGLERVAVAGSAVDMAQRYVTLLQEVMAPIAV